MSTGAGVWTSLNSEGAGCVVCHGAGRGARPPREAAGAGGAWHPERGGAWYHQAGMRRYALAESGWRREYRPRRRMAPYGGTRAARSQRGPAVPDAAGATAVVVADYDNDLRPDISRRGSGRCAPASPGHARRLRHVSKAAGVWGRTSWASRSVAFLDIEIATATRTCCSRASAIPLAQQPPATTRRGRREPGAPAMHLLRNNGNGTFADVTGEAGLAGDAPRVGRGPHRPRQPAQVELCGRVVRRAAGALPQPARRHVPRRRGIGGPGMCRAASRPRGGRHQQGRLHRLLRRAGAASPGSSR